MSSLSRRQKTNMSRRQKTNLSRRQKTNLSRRQKTNQKKNFKSKKNVRAASRGGMEPLRDHNADYMHYMQNLYTTHLAPKPESLKLGQQYMDAVIEDVGVMQNTILEKIRSLEKEQQKTLQSNTDEDVRKWNETQDTIRNLHKLSTETANRMMEHGTSVMNSSDPNISSRVVSPKPYVPGLIWKTTVEEQLGKIPGMPAEPSEGQLTHSGI